MTIQESVSWNVLPFTIKHILLVNFIVYFIIPSDSLSHCILSMLVIICSFIKSMIYLLFNRLHIFHLLYLLDLWITLTLRL